MRETDIETTLRLPRVSWYYCNLHEHSTFSRAWQTHEGNSLRERDSGLFLPFVQRESETLGGNDCGIIYSWFWQTFKFCPDFSAIFDFALCKGRCAIRRTITDFRFLAVASNSSNLLFLELCWTFSNCSVYYLYKALLIRHEIILNNSIFSFPDHWPTFVFVNFHIFASLIIHLFKISININIYAHIFKKDLLNEYILHISFY